MLQAVNAFLGRVYQRIKSVREGRNRTVYEIVHNDDTMRVSWLTMENVTGEMEIGWHEVNSIRLFKRDLFAVDLICLEFTLSNNSGVEVNEEMGGWESLVQQLPEYLPGCQKFEEWFDVVAFPAFELNLTTIYQRNDQDSA